MPFFQRAANSSARHAVTRIDLFSLRSVLFLFVRIGQRHSKYVLERMFGELQENIAAGAARFVCLICDFRAIILHCSQSAKLVTIRVFAQLQTFLDTSL